MQFMPSDRVLEEICGDREELVFHYIEIPSGLSNKQIERTLRSILVGTIYQVAENFKWGLDVRGQMRTKKLLIVNEALKNAVVHGSRNQSSVQYGLFLGDLGVCYGFRDGGDYFRSEEVKRLFESKTPVTRFQRPTEEFLRLSGWGAGVNKHIYPYSDIIEVDTGEGVLYCVQYKRSLERSNP